MNKSRIRELQVFQDSIGYEFNNLDLLNIAFTHSSYTNENASAKVHNERLEFLGDSVVNLVITDLLFNNFQGLPEGDLTRIRASLICEDSFARVSEKLKIPNFILLGKGEEKNGGRHRKSLIADAFEAFCGSLYLDSSYKTAKDLILSHLAPMLLDYVGSNNPVDFKTLLQEEIQKNSTEKIKYSLLKSEGPDHEKIFYFKVLLGSKVLGFGQGKSKKETEHGAAQDALKNMGIIDG